MTCIYENTIKGMGDQVKTFDDMFILFGDNAPDSLKDFCYIIDVEKVNGIIAVGDMMEIDGIVCEIMELGDIMQKNLESLGHISIRFGGECLPGSVILKAEKKPELRVGSAIRILKKFS